MYMAVWVKQLTRQLHFQQDLQKTSRFPWKELNLRMNRIERSNHQLREIPSNWRRNLWNCQQRMDRVVQKRCLGITGNVHHFIAIAASSPYWSHAWPEQTRWIHFHPEGTENADLLRQEEVRHTTCEERYREWQELQKPRCRKEHSPHHEEEMMRNKGMLLKHRNQMLSMIKLRTHHNVTKSIQLRKGCDTLLFNITFLFAKARNNM